MQMFEQSNSGYEAEASVEWEQERESKEKEILALKEEGELDAYTVHVSIVGYDLGEWLKENGIQPDIVPPRGQELL